MVRLPISILSVSALCLAANAWGTEPTTAPDPALATQAPAPVVELSSVAPGSTLEWTAPAAPAAVPGAPSEPASSDAAAAASNPATSETSPASSPATSDASPAAGAAPSQPASADGQPADASDMVPVSLAATPPNADLWQHIRKGFAMPDLTNKRAANSTHWYAGQPEYISRMNARASLYLYYIVQEIEKRGLPTELALLPFVESAMQPQAVSSAQAAGLWQFMPATGKVYSLEQNLWKDERLGVVESTRAALDYLEKLYAEFGSWQLALAAYNYGEAGVERAIAYNRKHHKPLNYESLRLPRETQNYVPKLQAIKNIISDPQHYGIELPAIRDEPYFVTVSGSRDIDVATAAQLADMPLEDFQALNPAFNRPLILGALAPTILLPADRGEKFTANLAAWQATGQPLASWSAYRLKSGESLGAVAQRVGVTEASLREANHVPPRYLAAAGSTILIPRDETSEDVSSEMLDGSVALVPEKAGLRKITVRVRRGDSLATIARKWHVGQDEIIAWNNLRSPDLFAGQRLSLTVAAASGSRKKAASHAAHGDSQNTNPNTTLAHAAAAPASAPH